MRRFARRHRLRLVEVSTDPLRFAVAVLVVDHRVLARVDERAREVLRQHRGGCGILNTARHMVAAIVRMP